MPRNGSLPHVRSSCARGVPSLAVGVALYSYSQEGLPSGHVPCGTLAPATPRSSVDRQFGEVLAQVCRRPPLLIAYDALGRRRFEVVGQVTR